CMQSTKDPLTF
nr:immunoglobulin light chain junction region [Macaca mulatta]MOV78529.1 immunoglobulin light chain junction region [Macaca mulatta]MOV78597.1 immunoglobulin light chain junction region [Macaca mulatta]MOV79067.1 immunoglobulin light chain junction region [Macaca mulatta]MOV79169.1 immunoglobulin light chain junction region [Macaca mulatta]